VHPEPASDWRKYLNQPEVQEIMTGCASNENGNVSSDHHLLATAVRLWLKIYNNINNNKCNKRPMGHIAHLSNLGQYRNNFIPYYICILFPFAPSDPI
jgi:hypothetical protein